MDSILNSVLYIICILVLVIVLIMILFSDNSSSDVSGTDVSGTDVSGTDTTTTDTTSSGTSNGTSSGTSNRRSRSGSRTGSSTGSSTGNNDEKGELWTRSCDLNKCNEAVWSVGDIKSDIWGGNCKQAEDYLNDCSNGSNGTMVCPAYICDPNQNDCLELKDCGGTFDISNQKYSCGTQNVEVSCDNGSIVTPYKKYKA